MSESKPLPPAQSEGTGQVVGGLQVIRDGMSQREYLIRYGFAFDSDRDCEAARYLIGVIDVLRWDRSLLRARLDLGTANATPAPPDTPPEATNA